MPKLPFKINAYTLFSKNCSGEALVVSNKYENKVKAKEMPAENLTE